MKHQLGKYAEELLGFQNTMFFRELELAYADISKDPEDEVGSIENSNRITNIIKNHTNLTIELALGEYGPAITTPSIDNNHVFYKGIGRKGAPTVDANRLVNEYGKVIEGSVNINKNEVSGAFATIRTTLMMPVSLIKNKNYSPAELAAITLHEVGHIFTYFEFISRTISTNQILSAVTRSMDNSATQAERTTLLVAARKAAELKDLNPEKLAQTNSKKVMEVVILQNFIRKSISELGSDVYDYNSWEALADNYAARCGAALPLATALDKLTRSSFNISYRSLPVYLFIEALKVISLLALPFGGGSLGLVLVWYTLDTPSPQYDRPGVRLDRIRAQMIERLKDKDGPPLTPKQRKELEDEIEVLTTLRKEVHDRLSFYDALGKLFFKSTQGRYDDEKLQQELETLVSNELFVASSELKNIIEKG